MSTHNICFRLEIRKIICGYPLLSVAMDEPPQNAASHQGLHCLPTGSKLYLYRF